MANVYVVHCVDTEGPLYEDKGVIFEQIYKIFGLKIENTQENYEKLKSGRMDLGNDSERIYNLVRNHNVSTKGSWNEIDEMLEKITSSDFRNKLPDSMGNGWIYNWFCMDHVGFWGDNPRRRDEGHHKIFDHYISMTEKQNSGDIVQFHHHPVPFSGNYNDSGTAYWGRDTLNQILARKIIDRQWFPCAYRPGFHTERPDSHWFLEQWIPFDYGNQSTELIENSQTDLSEGRFGDWRHAPKEWYPYHPSHDDYQVKGNCRRWITRCLNMKARVRQMGQADVDAAFEMASKGTDCILAFTDHDYKDMEDEICIVRNMIFNASRRYRDVKFIYASAINAMRAVLKLRYEIIGLEMDVDFLRFPKRVLISAENKIFGSQPFLAIKNRKGGYYWDNFDFIDTNRWCYTFDNNTMQFEDIECIGIAANNSYGITEVVVYNCKDDKFVRKILNI